MARSCCHNVLLPLAATPVLHQEDHSFPVLAIADKASFRCEESRIILGVVLLDPRQELSHDFAKASGRLRVRRNAELLDELVSESYKTGCVEELVESGSLQPVVPFNSLTGDCVPFGFEVEELQFCVDPGVVFEDLSDFLLSLQGDLANHFELSIFSKLTHQGFNIMPILRFLERLH